MTPSNRLTFSIAHPENFSSDPLSVVVYLSSAEYFAFLASV